MGVLGKNLRERKTQDETVNVKYWKERETRPVLKRGSSGILLGRNGSEQNSQPMLKRRRWDSINRTGGKKFVVESITKKMVSEKAERSHGQKITKEERKGGEGKIHPGWQDQLDKTV